MNIGLKNLVHPRQNQKLLDTLNTTINFICSLELCYSYTIVMKEKNQKASNIKYLRQSKLQ